MRDPDSVDWSSLRHAYGPAADVPGHLRRIAAGGEDEALDALDELTMAVHHQGGGVQDSATALLPFLVDIAEDAPDAVRTEALELVALIARDGRLAAPRWVHEGWPAAWAAELPRVLALLDGSGGRVRRAALSALEEAGGGADAVVPVLLARSDADPADRLAVLLALGSLAAHGRPETRAAALARLRERARDGDPQTALAAEAALRRADPGHRPAAAAVIAALSAPDIAVWPEVLGTPSAASAVTWAASLLGDGVRPRTEAALALAAHPDPARRTGAVRVIAGVLTASRAPEAELLPVLTLLGADEAVEARALAAHLMAAARGDAGALAARLDDRGPVFREGGEEIADIAVWGLAVQRDARCLPGLLARIEGPRCCGADVVDSGTLYIPWIPSIAELLDPMAEHAAALLPAIRSRLAARRESHPGLIRALARWGPVAAPAVPELTRLLKGADWPHVLDALAAIGPAAADALPRIEAGRFPHDSTPWQTRAARVGPLTARWRIAGDPGPLLDAVAAAPAADHLAEIADLGPAAVAHGPALRALLDDRDEWTRVRAANALHRVTGDPDEAARALRETARDLAARPMPVSMEALRLLAAIRADPGPLRPMLADLLASDRRHRYHSGRRAFDDDRAIRANAALLLA
ncbi:hypothetical protein [Actinomadura parmotrematis]|uniref:HEAT repeat domain-containing protein n=1 Tax=Actinomadura parmotrematis TaxID=2864039 RepID=A0ABS7G384_9ACTN|nr:hypothetical protein [Actinomadura parmotrematis]MBW8487173.1 hypothetical protein [Actinomadura parmotrematis]